MKTAREFLEKEFHAFGNDELQLYITLNPDVNRIISAMEDYTKQKLLQHGVMQAEGSDGAKGAAVASEGQGEANKRADFPLCDYVSGLPCTCKEGDHCKIIRA